MSAVAHRVLQIVNEKGLHARASAKFVEVVEGFDARAEVQKDGMTAAGDSIMGSTMMVVQRSLPLNFLLISHASVKPIST